MKEEINTIWTIGHSTRSLEEFIAWKHIAFQGFAIPFIQKAVGLKTKQKNSNNNCCKSEKACGSFVPLQGTRATCSRSFS